MLNAVDYGKGWNEYYRSFDEGDIAIPWDVDAEQAAAEDLTRFVHSFERALPIVDIGCGTGTQTRFLRSYYDHVLGVDISAHAIRLASAHALPGLAFEALDILDAKAVRRLASHLGCANIYMRGVLQQVVRTDRSSFIHNLSTLMGDGTLYLNELSTDSPLAFARRAREDRILPKDLARVLAIGVTRFAGVSTQELSDLFPSETFSILESGTASIRVKSFDSLTDIPSVWAVIKHR